MTVYGEGLPEQSSETVGYQGESIEPVNPDLDETATPLDGDVEDEIYDNDGE